MKTKGPGSVRSRALEGGMARRQLCTHRILLCVTVCAPRAEEVDHPAEHSGRADPRKSREYQPQESDNDPAIVDLPQTGDQKTQESCNDRFSHLVCHLRTDIRFGGGGGSVKLAKTSFLANLYYFGAEKPLRAFHQRVSFREPAQLFFRSVFRKFRQFPFILVNFRHFLSDLDRPVRFRGR